MYLSEIRVVKEVLCGIYFTAGLFFTFFGLPLKGITFYIWGFLAASLAAECLLDWIHEEFVVDIDQNVWWGILAALGIIGGWITGSNEILSMFLSCAIPFFFFMTFIWHAAGVDTWDVEAEYGKSLVCLTAASLMGVLLVKHCAHTYDRFLMCVTALLGSYSITVGANILYLILNEERLMPFAPDELMNLSGDQWYNFDLLVVVVVISSWFALCLLGIGFQHFRSKYIRVARKAQKMTLNKRSLSRSKTKRKSSTRPSSSLKKTNIHPTDSSAPKRGRGREPFARGMGSWYPYIPRTKKEQKPSCSREGWDSKEDVSLCSKSEKSPRGREAATSSRKQQLVATEEPRRNVYADFIP